MTRKYLFPKEKRRETRCARASGSKSAQQGDQQKSGERERAGGRVADGSEGRETQQLNAYFRSRSWIDEARNFSLRTMGRTRCSSILALVFFYKKIFCHGTPQRATWCVLESPEAFISAHSPKTRREGIEVSYSFCCFLKWICCGRPCSKFPKFAFWSMV